MSNAGLVAFQQAIASNNLQPSQQAALLSALAAIVPIFPEPDQTSSVVDQAISSQWTAVLFAIAFESPAPPPSPSPNSINASNPGPLGPAASVRFDSPPIAREKSGQIYVDFAMSGTQTLQAIVSLQLWRDFGTLGQTALGVPIVAAPGGVGAFNWWGNPTDLDHLTDFAPHVYTLIATGSGGSALSVATGSSDVQAFEIGAPG